MPPPPPKPEYRERIVPKELVKVPTETKLFGNLLALLTKDARLLVRLDDKMYALDGPSLLTDPEGNPQGYVFECRLVGEVGL
jgi:hypothetical protein